LLIVVGLSLKNLHPRVWDPESPYYLPDVQAVMVSYADFHRMPAKRRAAMADGLHAHLGIPDHIKIFLDNGAYYFLSHHGQTPYKEKEYERFVARARPDWHPIPRDYIPTPSMSEDEQHRCFTRTMRVNHAYRDSRYTPVAHIGPFLSRYTAAIMGSDYLAAKPAIALGGIVPNLLRAPKAMAYTDLLDSLRYIREVCANKQLHVFGIGGTATLHIAALLGMDSIDSSGWRNRAARGIVQLPGSGDRSLVKMGSWRGREPSPAEWEILRWCECPACRQFGVEGLKAPALAGFCNRATHNLWVLLREKDEVERHLENATYNRWFTEHLDNSIYLPLIQLLAKDGHSLLPRSDGFPGEPDYY
jgi:7-cyano-7-deazaguanine tRNA-ribosyltransferase